MTKHRLQFDISPEALKELDQLREESGAATRAELLRNALRVYSWFLEHRREGFRLVLEKGSERTQVELLTT